jgi:hypothetical protein
MPRQPAQAEEQDHNKKHLDDLKERCWLKNSKNESHKFSTRIGDTPFLVFLPVLPPNATLKSDN